LAQLEFDRRGFLAGTAILGASAVGGNAMAAAKPFFTRTHLPIGIQLYTLGPDAQKDLDGTLKAVADIGYKRVELAGLYGRTPADFRAALDKAGLKCVSAHIQAKGPSSFADTDKLAADLNVLGVETAVLPSAPLPERLGGPKAGEGIGDYLRRVTAELTADDWKAAADFLNAKGKALKSAGIKVGYHNHNFEFAPLSKENGVGGTTGLDILLANTDPKLVTFEADIGWVAAAGVDPYAFLTRHKGRFTMMHVKDVKKATKPNFAFQMDPAEIGAGDLDWKRLLREGYAAGVRGFYVEQEPPFTRPRLEAAKIDYDYLAGVVA
jgi:sugar phosphate isomerase/epimerase